MSAASMQIVIEGIDKASGVFDTIQKGLNGITTTAERFQSTGKNISKVGQKMALGLTAPIVAGLGLAVKSAVDFEAAMGQVYKTTGLDATSEGAQKLSKEILSMSTRIPIAATGLADIAAQGAQLGIAAGDLGKFTDAVAKNSIAFDMNPSETANSFAKLQNIYGATIDETTSLFDAINHLSNNSAASAAEIVDASVRSAGAGKQFGLLDTQVAALTSTLIGFGFAPEVVGTSLNAMLPRLQNASRQTETFQNGLKAAGLSATQLEDAIATNALGGLDLLMGKLAEMDAKTRSGIIADMFGSGGDAQVFTALVNNLEQVRKAQQLVAEQAQYSGSSLSEFEAKMKSTEQQAALFGNRVQAVGITIGSAMLPKINEMMAALGPLATKFAGFVDAHPGMTALAIKIALVAAAVGPLLIVVGSVVSAIGSIIGAVTSVSAFAVAAWGVLSGLATGIMTVMAGIAAAVTLSGLAIVALVAGLIAAAVAVVVHWSSVKAFFASLGASIASSFQRIVAGASAAFSSAAAAARSAGAAIGAGFQSAVGAVAGAMGSIVSTVVGALSGLAGQARAMGSRVVSGIADGIRAGISAISGAMASVQAAIAARMPGSPVKEGVLKDTLNGKYNAGYRITEMLATGLNAGSGLLGGAMGGAAQPVASALPTARASSGANSINVNVTVNAAAGSNGASIAQDLKSELRSLLPGLLREVEQERSRVSYG